MYTNNNLTHTTASTPPISFNSSLTPLPYLYPTPQSQTSTPSCAPFSSSELYNTAPSFQQEYQHLCSHQLQSQLLTPDEWNLILTLRMMKTLNVLPSFQPSSSSLYRHAGDLTSYQSTSSSYHTGHQLPAPTSYTTATEALTTSSYYNETSSIHPYAASTTASSSPSLLTTAFSSTAPLITAASSSASYTTVTSSLPRDTTAASSSPLLVVVSSSSAPYTTTTSSLPPYTIDPSLSSPCATASSLSSPYTTASSSSPSTALILQEFDLILSPRIQQVHPNDSSRSQLQLHSPTSPPVNLISSIQQQKSPNQYSSAVPQQTQSVYSHASTTYQYDSLMTGPIVQLLNPTKPYKIGDTIKVGGRTLQSDTESIKYWIEDDITITETTNEGHILNMAGYSYFRKNSGKNFTTWECEYRRRKHCSSIVIRSSDPTIKNYFRIYSIQGEHIHHPTPENIEIRLFKQRVRDRCRQELSCPRTIYEHELQKGKYSGEMLALLPTFYNMQAQLYRIRQEHLPASPTDPNFQLHPGFTTTDKGKRFLLYDSNTSQAPYVSAPSEVGRLLIYSSDLQLVILSKSKRIGSDGTFETAAQISYQNYIIMGEYEEKHPVPLVFCLCEHKSYETYKLIIQVLKIAFGNLKLDWNPIYWMSDYEDALTKAIKEELPNTQLLGCNFHYCQAIYRNIQNKGLQDAYQNVETVRQILRYIMALAFIPHDRICTVYYDIIKPELNDVPTKPASLRQNLRTFFKYYESHWLTKINKFCVFDQPTRTNNGLEGYNNKMNFQLSAHPHLYRLILWFEKEELLVQQLVSKLNSDQQVHKRKQSAITILINDSLQTLWDSYNAGKLTTKELLLESSRWVAKKAS